MDLAQRLDQIGQSLKGGVVPVELIEGVLEYSKERARDFSPRYSRESLTVLYKVGRRLLDPPREAREIEYLLETLLTTPPEDRPRVARDVSKAFSTYASRLPTAKPRRSRCSIVRRLQHDIAMCYMATSGVLPHERPELEEMWAAQRHTRIRRLLIAYTDVVETEFTFLGNDVFATQIVEFSGIVESSYSRTLIELCAQMLGRIFALADETPFNKFEPRFYIDDLSRLERVSGVDLGKAAAGPAAITHATLERLHFLSLREYEIVNNKAEYAQSRHSQGPSGKTPGREPPPLQEVDRVILRAMLRIGATADSPRSRDVILKAAGEISDCQSAFQRLKDDLKYIDAKQSTGTWLTLSGLARASSL